MHRTILRLLHCRFAAALTVLGALANCIVSAAAPSAAPAERPGPLVILVSIDGFASYYLDDPKARIPALRRMMREGAAAQGLVCSFPTVTWPNHTTLVTGVPPTKHGVIGNNVLDRETGSPVPFIPDPLFDKDQIVQAPTIYDAAHDAGLTTAGIIWPATRNATTLDFTVPDMRGQQSWQKYGTASWLAELRADGLPVDRYGAWVESPTGGVQRDWLYTQMACQLVRRHQPNLILLHLVEVDHAHHAYGPESPEAYWSISYADDRLRDLLDAIEQAGLRERATVLAVSDHGFFSYEKTVSPNVLLRRAGLVRMQGGKVVGKDAWVVAQGGSAAVYVLDDARRHAILEQLRDLFDGQEGITRVIEPHDFASLGQPTRESNPQAPDLWLATEEGYSFSSSLAGEAVGTAAAPRGSHGYLPEHPRMHGIFVAWGAAIKPGAKLLVVSNLDVAPSIARLLGISLPQAEGRPLTELFR